MPTVISVENLSKSYRLGQIGTGTLTNDLKVWWARARGKPNPLLKIGTQDPSASAETIWALRNVSFTVEQGEVLGIIGRNGAGKSTLLKILSRVTAPTSGQIKVKGRIASLLEVGTGFHPELTGCENIFLNGAILGMNKAEVTRKLDEIVAFAEIEKFLDTPVKRYSSGMYVRLAFAVAAHLEPEILLVDEVLAVGDAAFQKKCLGKMSAVAAEGRTVLFVSHNMAAIENLCTAGLFLEKGNLIETKDIFSAIQMYSGTSEKHEKIYSSGPIQRIAVRQEGKSIVISVKYCVNFDLYYPGIGFVVSDHAGYRLFGTNAMLDDVQLERKLRKSGTVHVKIRQPELYNGTYKLSVWFGDGKQDIFVDKDCIDFDILNMASGKHTTKMNHVPLHPLCEWEFVDTP